MQRSKARLCRFQPKPLVATSVEDIVKARGVKPCLSPNLDILATVEAMQVKRLLFIGVGCQVQALRAVEQYLPCEKLYVLGTNCVDNGPRRGLEKFLNKASNSPATALHYEFMQARSAGGCHSCPVMQASAYQRTGASATHTVAIISVCVCAAAALLDELHAAQCTGGCHCFTASSSTLTKRISNLSALLVRQCRTIGCI